MKKTFCILPIMIILCVFGLFSCNRQHVQQIETNGVDQTGTGTTFLSATTAQTEPLPTKEELPYTGMLYAEYSDDAGYYSCMYVDYDTDSIWRSTERPNLDDPTQSDNFDIAYAESVDPALFVQAVRVAVDTKFEEQPETTQEDIDSDYRLHAQVGFGAGITFPEAHIAVYNTNGRVRWVGGIGICQGANSVVMKVYDALSHIRNSMDIEHAVHEQTPSSELVAILYHFQAYGGYAAEYRTAERIVTWNADDLTFDFRDPLNTPNMSNVAETKANGLFYVKNTELLPMNMHTPREYAIDDASRQTVIFYYADGSVFVTSRETQNKVSEIWNQIDAEIHKEIS